MEGSQSEAVFESLHLQLFVNEVLNTVDDVFQIYSTKRHSIQRSQDLKKSVDCIRQKIHSVLDQRLAIWENYCLHHCFSVPQGFFMLNSVNLNTFSGMNWRVRLGNWNCINYSHIEWQSLNYIDHFGFVM